MKLLECAPHRALDLPAELLSELGAKIKSLGALSFLSSRPHGER
jgi:hypothetical protein